jgi:hypothetical protein
MYHLDGSHKHEENSDRGLMAAINGGFDSWDGDLTKSHDQVILNNHWNEPILRDGFHDPQHKFGQDFKVHEHPAAASMRLVADPGHYVIRPIRKRFITAGTHRIVFSLEPKGPYWNVTDMEYLWELAHQYQRPTIIKCAYTAPLVAARQVGFQTRYTVDHKPGM